MESKGKIGKRVVYLFLILISMLYFSFYIALNAGYYEYIKRQETTFTSEQIKKFEDDVLLGNPVDIENYMGNVNPNNLSNRRLGNSISDGISKYATISLERIFKILNNLIEE